jgi:Integral membrane protein possibly involved in chromosome condensation
VTGVVEGVAVAVGGAIGATTRAAVGRRLDGRQSTVAVNVLGSLLLGVVSGWAAVGAVGATAATLIGTGFCGAFTTYSSVAVETESLVADGDWQTTVVFVGGTLVTALFGAAVGGAAAGV